MKTFIYYFIQKLVDSKFLLRTLTKLKLVSWVSKYSKSALLPINKKSLDENNFYSKDHINMMMPSS